MGGWLYAAACVAVPAVWGIIMYLAFNLVDRRHRDERPDAELPPIDYTI